MDAFAILSLPRQLTLSESRLQSAYAEKSRVSHPDHGGSDALASEVNAACDTLRTPDRRLKHFLELAAPAEARAWRTVPLDDGMMSLFTGIGQALEASNRFLDKKNKAQSALARALLAHEEMIHRESLEALGIAIADRMREMEDLLPALDESLARDATTEVWKQLAALQARFAYLAKWQTQIRERLLQLM